MINQLLLKANFKNYLDEIVSDLFINVAFFSPTENLWIPFINNTSLEKGSLNINFTAKTKGAEPFFTILNKSFEIGSIPQIRLTNANPINAKMEEILASSGIITMDNTTNTLVIQYGDLWLHHTDLIKEQVALLVGKVAAIQVTTPIPNDKTLLYKTLASALAGKTPPVDTSLDLEKMKIENEKLTIQLKEANDIITNLESRTAIPTSDSTLSASKVYTGVIDEIAKAAAEMNDSKYEIAALKLDLKVLVKNDEAGNLKLQMVDDKIAERVSGDSLSMLTIDISPKDIVKANTAMNAIPKLIGLTETETRKKLADYGLKLQPIYQATDKYVIGQAFRQSPEAGTEIIAGSTVTVIFAKNKNVFN